MSQAGQINCFSVLSFFLANYLAFILIFFKDLFGIYFGILCCSPCGIYFDIFFDILYGMCFDTLSGSLYGILSDICLTFCPAFSLAFCLAFSSGPAVLHCAQLGPLHPELACSIWSLRYGVRAAQHPEPAIWSSGPAWPTASGTKKMRATLQRSRRARRRRSCTFVQSWRPGDPDLPGGKLKPRKAVPGHKNIKGKKIKRMRTMVFTLYVIQFQEL